MNRFVSLSAVVAALSLTPAAMAQDAQDAGTEHAENVAAAEAVAEEAARAVDVEAVAEAAAKSVDVEAVAKAAKEQALADAAADVAATPTPAKLVDFDGERKFLSTSRRLRVWRANVGYTLTVDAEGSVTDCELTEEFRRTYVNLKLCEVLMAHHKFEPARDEENEPVEGSYTNRLVYLDMRNKEE